MAPSLSPQKSFPLKLEDAADSHGVGVIVPILHQDRDQITRRLQVVEVVAGTQMMGILHQMQSRQRISLSKLLELRVGLLLLLLLLVQP